MNKSVSIILTIYNKEFLIKRVLDSIIKNKSPLVKELIIIFDSCTDKSEEYTKEILDSVKDIDIIYKYENEAYEIKCNNIGLKTSSCSHSMIIQDDMIIDEQDFDSRMLKPFMFKDVFAVTSRMAHNDNYFEKKFFWNSHIGFDPYSKYFLPSPRNIFGIRDVCNRGPFLVDNEKIQKLGYLDLAFWPQSLDEHDICLKAWKNYKWVSGSYWIKWKSKEEWGGTRQNAEKYQWLETCAENNKKILIERYLDLLNPNSKHNEDRFIL
jgi:hypothetical protein